MPHMRQDLKIWLDRALYFKVDSVCGQSAGPHPSSASAAELSTRRCIFHRISRLCLAQGFGCHVQLVFMLLPNYNFYSGLWRGIRFSKIMRFFTLFIAAKAGNKLELTLNNTLIKMILLNTCLEMEEHAMSYHSHRTMAAFASSTISGKYWVIIGRDILLNHINNCAELALI